MRVGIRQFNRRFFQPESYHKYFRYSNSDDLPKTEFRKVQDHPPQRELSHSMNNRDHEISDRLFGLYRVSSGRNHFAARFYPVQKKF